LLDGVGTGGLSMKRRQFIRLIGGAAAAWPIAARAQQSSNKIPVVGVLWHAGSAEEEGPNFNALVEGFNALGYVDQNNIRLEHRFPNEVPDRFRSMAAELVASKVDVLVGVGTATAPYAKNATTTIPVVLTVAPDPVAAKLVDSFARPGGNVTALTYFAGELAGFGKRLELLKEILPQLNRVAVLWNAANPYPAIVFKETQAVGRGLGIEVQSLEVRSPDDFDGAFEDARRQA
jgi:putative ABC transport system substrate-binding protein